MFRSRNNPGGHKNGLADIRTMGTSITRNSRVVGDSELIQFMGRWDEVRRGPPKTYRTWVERGGAVSRSRAFRCSVVQP